MSNHKVLSKWLFAVIYVSVIALCVLSDQLTKLLIFDNLLESKPGNSVDIMGKFLRFYALYNSGASFGIGKSDSANIVFFIVTVLGLPVFCYLLWRSRTRSTVGQIGFAFIVGGTIGNAIDRMFVQTKEGQFFSGEVRDFISFSIFEPVFNIADSFLVVGVVLAILAIVFFDPDALVPTIKQEHADKNAAKAAMGQGGGQPSSRDGAQPMSESENPVTPTEDNVEASGQSAVSTDDQQAVDDEKN